MGAIERYFQLMNEEQVDRVLEAQEWTSRQLRDDDNGSARCLRGHAINWNGSGLTADRDLVDREQAHYKRLGFTRHPAVAVYNRLARRFGLSRAVVLVKQRAAKRAEELRATPVVVEQVAA